MKWKEFRAGLLAGIPIALGYLSVSIGVGILAIQAGMSIFEAVIMSLTNLTSAGEAAGIAIIGAGGSLIEMAVTQLVINLRYSLMGLSLTQKTDEAFHTPQRMAASFGITDEIFAVASGRPRNVTPYYMYGIILIATAGWTFGTFIGALAGDILPASITNALGILLYGMFIAIIFPAAKKNTRIYIVIVIACALSCLFHYVFTSITSGFAIIISAIIASLIAAVLFPVKDEEDSV